jgi:hypothetical protein
LLGIDPAHSERYRHLIHAGLLGVKPGWVRISIPYYASPADVSFLLGAVELAAEHGDAFLPLYRLSWRDGSWTCLRPQPETPPRVRLDAASLWSDRDMPTAAEVEAYRVRVMEEARALADALRERWRVAPPAWNPPTGVAELDALAWFRYVEHERP